MSSKSSGLKKKYVSPGYLAKGLGCSARTVREYCKRGLIKGAVRTPGGHLRIPFPLRQAKELFWHTLKRTWGVDDRKDALGDFEPEWAQTLMEAHVRDMEVEKLYENEEQGTKDAPHSKAEALVRIEKEIFAREANGQPVWDIQLVGLVKQYWLKYQCCPTVEQIAAKMRISRSEFYRRGLSSGELRKAYRIGCGEFGSDLSDPSGLDSVESANRKAKKPGFAQLHRDPYGVG